MLNKIARNRPYPACHRRKIAYILVTDVRAERWRMGQARTMGNAASAAKWNARTARRAAKSRHSSLGAGALAPKSPAQPGCAPY